MSVCNAEGEKVDLSRDFGLVYSRIETDWAGVNQKRWQCLAMLQLFEFCDWTEARIALCFGINQGTVSRQLKTTRLALLSLSGLQELAAEIGCRKAS